MLLAASESAVTKKPRLRLTMRRSSSVRPFGSFHSRDVARHVDFLRHPVVGAGGEVLLPRPLVLERHQLVDVGLAVDDALVGGVDAARASRRGDRRLGRRCAAASRPTGAPTATRAGAAEATAAGAMRAADARECGWLAVLSFAGLTSSSQTSIVEFPVRPNYESVAWEAQALIDFSHFLLRVSHRVRVASCASASRRDTSADLARTADCMHAQRTSSHHWQASQPGSSMHAELRCPSPTSTDAGSKDCDAAHGFEHAGPATDRMRARAARHRIQLAAFTGRLLGGRRAERAQVVGGLQAAQPGELVGLVELLARGAGHVDVQRLRLVDPLLAARRRLRPATRSRLRTRWRRALRRSSGTRSICAQRAVEVLEVRRPSRRPTGRSCFRSRTRYSLTTVNSPDRFDLTIDVLVRRARSTRRRR